MFTRLASSVIALVLALGAAQASAAVVSTQSTYTFSGTCTDCAGFGNGELVLQNYTLGSAITANNFVSFHYDGTNLLPAFTVQSSDATYVSGQFNAPLPKAEDFGLYSKQGIFQSFSNGNWCVGISCLADYGSSHLWNNAASTPVQSTPEPISASLLGIGTCAAVLFRRRRA